MATRPIVPRADNEGGIGTTLKKWATGFIKILTVDSITIGTLATQNPPLDADLWIIRASASAWALVTATGTQIKAYLKTYFDTIYDALGLAATVQSNLNVLAREPDQGVALTAAASGSSGIVVADNANIDFGTGNFALVWKGSLPDWTPSAGVYLIAKVAVDGSYGVRLLLGTDGKLDLIVILNNAATEYKSSIATGFVDNTTHEIVVDVIRETDSVAGSVVISADGIQLGNTIAITATATVSLSNNGTCIVMGLSDARTAGTCIHAYTLNFAPTAAEVLDIHRNGLPEWAKWGSQTNIIVGNDSTFAGANNWQQDTMNAFDETTGGVLTVTASASHQFCRLPVANAPMVVGKRYCATVTVGALVSTWSIHSFGSAWLDNNVTPWSISAEGTQSFEFTAYDTGGLMVYAMASNSSATFDNFSLVEIGATLALTPESWQSDKPYDCSSNNLAVAYPATGWSLTRRQQRADDVKGLAITAGKTLTVSENVNLDEAVAMSSKAPKASPSFTAGIGIGGVAAGAGGVAFPATQVAVADPNTLDDYDEYTAASTACDGALTVSVVWKLVKIGKLVTLVLPATLGTASAETSFTYGVGIPAKYRPAYDTIFNIAPIRDAGAYLSTPGCVNITIAGGINIYKDGTFASLFTAAANTGTHASVSVSWIL